MSLIAKYFGYSGAVGAAGGFTKGVYDGIQLNKAFDDGPMGKTINMICTPVIEAAFFGALGFTGVGLPLYAYYSLKEELKNKKIG